MIRYELVQAVRHFTSHYEVKCRIAMLKLQFIASVLMRFSSFLWKAGAVLTDDFVCVFSAGWVHLRLLRGETHFRRRRQL